MKNKTALLFVTFFLLNTTTWGEIYLNLQQKGGANIVRWPTNNVVWYLNINGAGDGFSYQQTKDQIQAAYNSWQNVSTSDITFSYGGSTSGSRSGTDYINGHYWVYSGDELFEEGGPFDPNKIGGPASAYTSFNINYVTYEMIDIDVRYNGEKTWYDDYTTWNDIQSVALHEIGHQIGLNHSNVASAPLSVMYVPNDPSTNNRRVLKFDDENGVSFLYGGNLVGDETFSGANYFSWSINNVYGTTLTFQPASTVYFKNGVSLIVNGNLNAVGNSTNRITFTRSGSSETWGGIVVNSGAYAYIQYCDINYASTGVTINNNSNRSQVTDCQINNNDYYGISIYNSQPSLQRNKIINSPSGGAFGIFCN